MKTSIKVFFLVPFLSSIWFNVNAQDPKPLATQPESGPVFTIVEDMPDFPGGEDAMKKFLAENIKYPDEAVRNNIQGTVYVSFVVQQDGKIVDTKVLRGVGSGCDEEALRVVNRMPVWKPGYQNGKAVKVQYNLPVHFKLASKK